MISKKKIIFVTGTRADYSKLAPLIRQVKGSQMFEVGVFVTGMHMLEKYGSTHMEVEATTLWDYKFINQSGIDSLPTVFAKTVQGFSDFLVQSQPDLVVVHGDRLEAIATSITCAMSNTLLAHIEGGELSGTVDDSYRHAITKLAQIHFVSNEDARLRVLRMGEPAERVFEIGSPELDLMHSSSLPSLAMVRSKYEIPWDVFGIVIFHPVATESRHAFEQADQLRRALVQVDSNFVVIESNNDLGSDGTRLAFEGLRSNPRFRLIPSMRYEFFLVLLQHAALIIGNSSTGVREAPHYGVPAVNVGSRQQGRTVSNLVVDCSSEEISIVEAISKALTLARIPDRRFGDGQSATRFLGVLESGDIWKTPIQKKFV